MSIQASFATLKTLQVLDARISKISEELAVEKAGISDKAERHAALMGRIERIESVISRMEVTKSELNQELRQNHVQVDKSREKMARCRNEREANAAQRELEEIRRLGKEREGEITKITGLIADARADIDALNSQRSEVSGEIDETEGQAVERVRALQSDMAENQAKRDEALSRLPKSVQSRYQAVHARRGSGTAAVVDGSCMACHISLSPMLYQELQRMQEFFQCPSCLRVLYIGDASDVPGDSSDAADDSDEAADEG